MYYFVIGILILVLVYVLIETHKVSKRSKEKLHDASYISIFSEGGKYWSTFSSIVFSLLENKCPVKFYTMDKNDPAFQIEDENFYIEYIGNGNFAFFKFNHIKAPILLTTTPNIGTCGYPIVKSPNVKCLIHVWHSFGDFAYAWYHKGSLDNYDEILATGRYMIKQIRLIEKKRNLPPKKIVVCGVPYLDNLYNKLSLNTERKCNNMVLIAPSWGNKSLFKYYDIGFIKQLTRAGYRVIIRPHPQSFKSEPQMIERIRNELKDDSNIIWDYGLENDKYLLQADIMISDTSSVRLDFAILYSKPVITLDTPIENIDEYEYADLMDLLKDNILDEKIGVKLNKENISDIVKVVKENILLFIDSKKIEILRKNYTVNLGVSGKYIAKYLIKRKEEIINK